MNYSSLRNSKQNYLQKQSEKTQSTQIEQNKNYQLQIKNQKDAYMNKSYSFIIFYILKKLYLLLKYFLYSLYIVPKNIFLWMKNKWNNVFQKEKQIPKPKGLYCKAYLCQQKHEKHYCKNCKNIDSDHRAINCSSLKSQDCNKNQSKFRKNQNEINWKQENQFNSRKCRVYGCSEAHSKHYCRFCQNNDSNHFSSRCPTMKNQYKTQSFNHKSNQQYYKKNKFQFYEYDEKNDEQSYNQGQQSRSLYCKFDPTKDSNY